MKFCDIFFKLFLNVINPIKNYEYLHWNVMKIYFDQLKEIDSIDGRGWAYIPIYLFGLYDSMPLYVVLFSGEARWATNVSGP